MKTKAKGVFGIIAAAAVLIAMFSGPLFSSEKRLKVISESADIHLDPNNSSTIIENVAEGTIVTLASVVKFRKMWNYVYFPSEKTGRIKSGYILDSLVERLYDQTKIITIKGSE